MAGEGAHCIVGVGAIMLVVGVDATWVVGVEDIPISEDGNPPPKLSKDDFWASDFAYSSLRWTKYDCCRAAVFGLTAKSKSLSSKSNEMLEVKEYLLDERENASTQFADEGREECSSFTETHRLFFDEVLLAFPLWNDAPSVLSSPTESGSDTLFESCPCSFI